MCVAQPIVWFECEQCCAQDTEQIHGKHFDILGASQIFECSNLNSLELIFNHFKIDKPIEV